MLPAGTRLGHYVVGKSLGKGGMGTVHEARDTRSGTVVALKVLDEKWLARPDIVARFRREAAAALALRHPCIVFLLDADLGARPPYLVFELQKGGSLADRLDRENRLPWRDAARIGAAIAAGLEAIHERGLVHRDLKPGNVLLDKKGHPRIADFGLVRGEKGSGIDPTSLTESGEVVGTIEFMAPEQVKAGGEVKAPADLYALGCVLHTLLTGEPPFSGTGVDLMKKHLRERPRGPRSHVRGIPRALDALVLRLLDKDPARRGDATTLARELDEIAKGPEPRDSRLAIALLAVGVLAAIAGGYLLRKRPEKVLPPPPPPPATQKSRAVELPVARRYGDDRWCERGRIRVAARFAPGRLVTGSAEGQVTIWNEEGAPVATARVSERPVVAIGAARETAVAADASGTVVLVRSPRPGEVAVRTLEDLHGSVARVVVSPSGKSAACIVDGAAAVWDLARDPPARVVGPPDVDLAAIAFTVNENLATGLGKGRLRLGGDPTPVFGPGETSPVRALAWRDSVDATGAGAGGGVLYLACGNRLVVPNVTSAHMFDYQWVSPDPIVEVVAPPGPEGLVCLDTEGRVTGLRWYDLARREPYEDLAPARAITAFDEKRFGMVGTLGGVTLVEFSSGKKSPPEQRHVDQVTGISFLPGKQILTAGLDGTFRIWSRETQLLMKTIDKREPIRSASISGARLVAIVGQEKHDVASVLPLPDLELVTRLEIGHARAAVLLSDRMALEANDKVLYLASLDEGKRIELGPTVAAPRLAFARDRVLVGGDGAVELRDASNSVLADRRVPVIWDPALGAASVTAVALSEDGQRGLAGDADGRLWVLDCAGRVPREVADAKHGAVVAAALSRDGKLAATASRDEPLVRVWAAEKGTLLGTVALTAAKREDFATTLAFDGDVLFVGTVSGSLLEVKPPRASGP